MIHHNQICLPKNAVLVSSEKKINVIYHIKRLKEKNHIMIPVDAKKTPKKQKNTPLIKFNSHPEEIHSKLVN